MTQRRLLIVQQEKTAQICRVGLHWQDRGRPRTASARYHATKTHNGRASE